MGTSRKSLLLILVYKMLLEHIFLNVSNMKTENTQDTSSFQNNSPGCNALKNPKVFNEQ